MKRKHEDSPGRSCDRNKKVSSPSTIHGKVSSGLVSSSDQSGRSQGLPSVLKTNKNNFGSNGLRRSSRKAALERRVWAEPRRERYPKHHSKGLSQFSKRGRPRKEIKREPRVVHPPPPPPPLFTSHPLPEKRETVNPKKGADNASSVSKGHPQHTPVFSVQSSQTSSDVLVEKSLSNSIAEHLSERLKLQQPMEMKQPEPEDLYDRESLDVPQSDAVTISRVTPTGEPVSEDDLEEEGMLIVDEVASLQGAVVEEVIKDYPHNDGPIASNMPIDSQSKSDYVSLESYQNNSSSQSNDTKDKKDVSQDSHSVNQVEDYFTQECQERRRTVSSCSSVMQECALKIADEEDSVEENEVCVTEEEQEQFTTQSEQQYMHEDELEQYTAQSEQKYRPVEERDHSEQFTAQSEDEREHSEQFIEQSELQYRPEGEREQFTAQSEPQYRAEDEQIQPNGEEFSDPYVGSATEAGVCEETADDDDNHVSLSEALAKLVESDDSAHDGCEPETVTIHPFTSEEGERGSLTSSSNSSSQASSNCVISTPLNMIEKRPPTDDQESFRSSISIMPLSGSVSRVASSPSKAIKVAISEALAETPQNLYYTRDNFQSSALDLRASPELRGEDPGRQVGVDSDDKENANISDSSSSEEGFLDGHRSANTFASASKQLVPPLIKVAAKAPVIRIPLKCSECPMRFCTVRSLLWHFGTHEPPDKEKGRSEVLLQDLVASWDPPEGAQVSSGSCQEKELKPSDGQSYFPSSTPRETQDTKSVLGICPGENGNREVILKVPVPRLQYRGFGVNCVSTFTGSDSITSPTYTNSVITDNTADISIHLTTTTATSFSHKPSFSPSSSSPPQCSSSTSSSASSSPFFISVLPRTNVVRRTSSSPEASTVTTTTQRFLPRLSPTTKFTCASTPTTTTITTSSSYTHVKSTPAIVGSSNLLVGNRLHLSGGVTTEAPFHAPVTTASEVYKSSFGSGGSFSSSYAGAQSSKGFTRVPPLCGEGTSPQGSAITVVPVERLGQLRQQIASKRGVGYDTLMGTSPPQEPKHSLTPLQEKDGLVMINPNLALRIISGSPDAVRGLTTPRQACSESLTILPQGKGSSGSKEESGSKGPPPDILTIVPQSDPAARQSSRSGMRSYPQLMTAAGKVMPDSSRVVKLVLLPTSKDDHSTGNDTEFLKHYPPRDPPRRTDSASEESEGESDEGGMVIDVREEEPPMDPLSLCAVTMEDEEPESSRQSESPPARYSDTNPAHLRPILPAQVPLSNEDHSPPPYPTIPPRHQRHKSPVIRRAPPPKRIDEEKYRRRKYVCPFCEKRFGWSTDLKRHVILHTGERPFKCKWCPITFTRKFLLQNHMKKIHSTLCKWSDLWE